MKLKAGEIQTPAPTQPASTNNHFICDVDFPQLWAPPRSLNTLTNSAHDSWRDIAFRPPLGHRLADEDEESKATDPESGERLPHSRIALEVTTTQVGEVSRGRNIRHPS